jgi:iron complex transport system ATP-binding protein
MSGPETGPPLRTENLSVGYPGRAVLSGLDLELRAGELVCLLGPNVAGKSTLLRSLAGLMPPLSGRLWLAGREADALSAAARARRTAIVLAGNREAGHLTVEELAALGRYPHTGWSGRLAPEDREAIRRGLEEAGVLELRARPCDELSDGERQRAMLARALAQDPAVLLLDEPTAFLDLPRRVEAMRFLREAARRRGRAVLLSTHDLDLALRAADRLWLAAEGAVRAGLPEDLVLQGAVGDIFARGGVAFDRATGQFRIQAQGTIGAVVRGDGEFAYWAGRALEREGFAIVAEAVDSHPVRIEALRRDGKALFRGEWKGKEMEFSDLESMVESLRSAFHGTP